MRDRTVAIVGRPNVGKSALFNRLAGQKIAIVHDMPGVTRDRISAECKLGQAPFQILDTGGIGSVVDASFSEQVRTEVDIAIETSRVILFVVDGLEGLTPVDVELARQLRRAKKPIILVINKIDVEKHEHLAAEFDRLGFDRILSTSAEHGRGIAELVEASERLLPPLIPSEEEAVKSLPLKIAIVGRPNVGKSSLINAILEDRRTIVSDVSGTTRDAVDIPYTHQGQPYTLIDTAGIRARGKVKGSVEVFSVMRSEKSIERADLCVMVIDASVGVTAMDRKIAGIIQENRKPCIIVMNKWDLIRPARDERRETLEERMEHIRSNLFFLDYAPVVLLSAKTGEHIERLFRAIGKVRRAASQRIGTGPLNRMLQAILSATPPPVRGGRRFKILYGTQVETESDAPIGVPVFLLFVNDPKSLAPHYKKHIEAKIREEAPFSGLPIVFRLKGRAIAPKPE